MHLLSSVTMIIDHSKVSYDLFFHSQTLRYFFKPTCLLTAWYLAPSFSLFKKDTAWQVKGTDNEALKAQAIDKIKELHSADESAETIKACLAADVNVA